MEDVDISVEKQSCAAALREHLQVAKTLRLQAGTGVRTARNRLLLREWQAARLARTHANLLASARYGQAAQFFLSDLYGPKDFSSRDDEVERILPLLIKLLPASALHTLALAVELDALTEQLDSAMVAELCRMESIEGIDENAYASAYRIVGRRTERQRQIVLIRQTGKALDKLAKKPVLTGLLKLMRGPAHLAGLADLHTFLDRGFRAFRGMGPADEFLDSIDEKEQRLLHRLFANAEDPFGSAALDTIGLSTQSLYASSQKGNIEHTDTQCESH